MLEGTAHVQNLVNPHILRMPEVGFSLDEDQLVLKELPPVCIHFLLKCCLTVLSCFLQTHSSAIQLEVIETFLAILHPGSVSKFIKNQRV